MGVQGAKASGTLSNSEPTTAVEGESRVTV